MRRSPGRSEFTSRPARWIDPPALGRSPAMASSSVVLPQPLLPMSTAYSPPGTANELPDRANFPCRTERLKISITGLDCRMARNRKGFACWLRFRRSSRQQLLHDLPMHVGEPEVAALRTVRQFFLVQSKQVL